MAKTNQLLFAGSDWDFDKMGRTFDAIEEIALKDLELDLYPNQLEIISSEQMLDAYTSAGMPLMYRHWSFGKNFISHENNYRKGRSGLAYEIVINSNPCISYNMAENTMPLQALVMAHAACGHNHFFKNNHLFKEWTDAAGILDYLKYARDYIAHCEEAYGPAEVEHLLDAAHALQSNSIFNTHRRVRTLREEEARFKHRFQAWEQNQSPLDGHIQPTVARPRPKEDGDTVDIYLPEENLLYFIEQHSPILKPWQREILRIVYNIAQYFYPQGQTKVMNEGCACFVHYHIMNELHLQGRITDGAMMEMLHHHTNVVFQPSFDDPRFGGLNPYTLGFTMMQDIKRICTEPTIEDRECFPAFAGCTDWRGVLKDAWANYRDESFIRQFLSPKVIRDQKLFVLTDAAEKNYVEVVSIHDQNGYQAVRNALAQMHDPSTRQLDIQIVNVDLLGDRTLYLEYTPRNDAILKAGSEQKTLAYCRQLWGYDVKLNSVM